MHADSFAPAIGLLWWNAATQQYTGRCWATAAGGNDITKDYTIPAGQQLGAGQTLFELFLGVFPYLPGQMNAANGNRAVFSFISMRR
jgi:hypothetical protein